MFHVFFEEVTISGKRFKFKLKKYEMRVFQSWSVSCLSFAQTLLQKTLTQHGAHVTCPEPELRCYLKCLIRICDVTEVNVDVIISLWDVYFSKKLVSLKSAEKLVYVPVLRPNCNKFCVIRFRISRLVA